MSRENIGRFLVSIKAEPTKIRNVPVGEYISAVGKVATLKIKERATGYRFGSRIAAAVHFTLATGIKCDWSDLEPDKEADSN